MTLVSKPKCIVEKPKGYELLALSRYSWVDSLVKFQGEEKNLVAIENRRSKVAH
jgi:hypothetical protein